MNLALINPPQSSSNSWSGEFAPLGIAYIASFLIDAGFMVDLIDMSANGISSNDLEHFLSLKEYSIVGITSMYHTLEFALDVAVQVKNVNSKSYTVLGGVPPTFEDVDILQKYNSIDIVVRGEGENTFVDLVNAINQKKNLRQVDGITYRNHSYIIKNRDRGLIKDLDILPIPAREMLPMQNYLQRSKAISISTTRGCAFSCAFCTVPSMWGKRWRARSVENVMKEIVQLNDTYDFEHLTFLDDTFTLNMIRTAKLCQALLNKQLDVSWSCTTRADRLTKSLITKMAAAGCSKIALGVESGSEKVLNNINKGETLEDIRKATEWIKGSSLKLKLNFMYGLPGEEEGDLNQTLDLVRILDPDEISFNKLTDFPGTNLTTSKLLTAFESKAEKTIETMDVKVADGVGYAFLGNHLSNSSIKSELTES